MFASPALSLVVFTATLRERRDRLGEDVTAWLRGHPGAEVVRHWVTQSSDRTHHCLTITLLVREAGGPTPRRAGSA